MEGFGEHATATDVGQLGLERSGTGGETGGTDLSCTDWNSLAGSSLGCGSSTVGSGWPGCRDVGKGGGGVGSLTGSASASGAASAESGGVAVLFLEACSARAAARAGSLLFFSLAGREAIANEGEAAPGDRAPAECWGASAAEPQAVRGFIDAPWDVSVPKGAAARASKECAMLAVQ